MPRSKLTLSSSIAIPPPYHTYAEYTRYLFRFFHERIGSWPWELVQGFEPEFWGQTLTQDFMTLLHIHLPEAPEVDKKHVLDYLRVKSAHHPQPKHAGRLNRIALAKAIEWLDEKRRARGLEKVTRPSHGGKSVRLTAPSVEHFEQDSSNNDIPNETFTISRGRVCRPTARKRVVSTSDDKSYHDATAGSRGRDYRRTVRKRVTSSNHYEPNNDAQIISTAPALKKRLIVNLKFTPLGGQQSIPTDAMSRDAETNYASYLENRIAKTDTDIRRAQSDINTITQQQTELVQIIHENTETKEKATADVSNAHQWHQHVVAKRQAEIEVNEQLRRISESHSSGISRQFIATMEGYEAAGRELENQKREAKAKLDEEKAHLADVARKLQMAEYELVSLQSKIDVLEETKRAGEKQKRSLVTMHRLVEMAPHLSDVLDGPVGDKSLDEWTQEKMRAIKRGVQ
ncbi:hypothetical protein F66182_9911 [Fusarium sp. NRRL 66182]|nr:hypothetical protein F66182_9911 [Fusarium sp. NRRL 66182]